MANYSAIKAAVNGYIKANGRKEITGSILNAILNATIDSLGRFFQFAGGALPTDDPGTPDQNVCYLAGEPGLYTNFGNIRIENEEVALLFWDGVWTKQRILIGIREVNASVDNQVGTPSVDVSYSGGVLVLTFHNLKGDKGDIGDPAGFGTIAADITGGVGTPGVSVETSGDNDAKNIMFHFTNLKGETGVTSVMATIDDTSGLPSCQVSLVNGVLTLAFSGLKGLKGDTGVSADYPITIYNGLDSDATDQALAAAQGKILDGKIGQLATKLGRIAIPTTETGKKINTDGAVGSTLPSPTTNASYRYMKYPVVAGDIIYVNAKGGSAPRAWCFADADNKILSAKPYTSAQVVETLVAPENSAWVVINDQSNSTSYYLSKDSLSKRVEDLENATITSDNLWEVTKEGGYYNGEGVFVSSENHNSCQIKMIPGADYRVVQQTTAAGGNYVRIFQLSGNTLTQVYNERTNGADVNYTCLDDGNTYILQAIWDLRQTTIGETEIYATMPTAGWIVYLSRKAREFDEVAIDVAKNTEDIAQNTEDIAEIKSELHSPDLWEVTTPGAFYNASGTLTQNTSYDGCQIYNAVNGHTYRVKMQVVSSGGGNYLRVYVVENGVLTQVYYKQQIGGDIDYTIPDDGKEYMLQTVMRKSTGDGSAPEIHDLSEDIFWKVDDIQERISDYRTIKILAIGNSYSRDAFMYFPFVLESMIPGVRISFGIMYKGGCTLEEHYDYILNGTDYPAFDFYRTGSGWTSVSNKNIDYGLAAENWDIILLQQRSYKSNDYATYQPYLNDIITLLQGKVDYNFRLGWFLTPALNDGCPEMEEATSDEMFENILVAVQRLMDETAVEFCIPCGTAIQNARTTPLKNLGDTGGLMYDNLHLQEGIPCLIEAYVAAIVIANLMGIPISVFGNQIRPTDAWITAHNIIQRHGSSVGVTDENCYIAQKCAAIAVKKPYEITDLTALGI